MNNVHREKILGSHFVPLTNLPKETLAGTKAVARFIEAGVDPRRRNSRFTIHCMDNPSPPMFMNFGY